MRPIFPLFKFMVNYAFYSLLYNRCKNNHKIEFLIWFKQKCKNMVKNAFIIYKHSLSKNNHVLNKSITPPRNTILK